MTTWASARRISVITAADPGRSPHLLEAYDSLRSQTLPPGCGWQWCLQIDGPELEPCGVPDDPRISARANGGRAGAAASRNLALSRADGDVVVTLDADDVLLPGALATVLDLFTRDEREAWVATGHVRLSPEGVPGAPEPLRIGTRTVEAGELRTWWSRFGHVPLIPHCVAYRTDAARAAGGWMALPRSEDTGLMMTVAESWPGRTLDVATLGYRRWPGQQTAEPWIADGSYAKDAGRRLIAQRLDALSRLSR